MDAALAALAPWLAPPGFVLHEASTWSVWHGAAFAVMVVLIFEALSRAVPLAFAAAGRIPARGAHHDKLDETDQLYLAINRACSVPFTYHYLKAAWLLPTIPWRVSEMTALNTLLPLPLLFLVYDLFYSLFHRALHHQSVYKLVHKHHHRQHAPSRGNTDAINVHPFEFIVGEYLHLVAVFLTGLLLRQVHVAAVLAFIVAGGVGASLNHTRLDVVVPFGVYDVKAHDVHHRLPKSNYGQYTMAWDRLLGTFRPYSYAPQGPKAAGGKGE